MNLILHKNKSTIICHIRFITVDITWDCTEEAIVDPDQELVIVESRSGLYNAIHHAMTGIQLAAGVISPSPFDKYILRLENHDSTSRAHNPHLDLSCLMIQLTPEQQQQQTMGSKDLEQIIYQRVTEQF